MMAGALAPTTPWRRAFLALAVAQHALAFGSLAMERTVRDAYVAIWPSAPLLVVAWLLLRRPPAADVDDSLAPLGWTVAISAVVGAALAVHAHALTLHPFAAHVIFGALGGLALAVTHGLLYARIDAWRRRAAVAARLDAWAMLACFAAAPSIGVPMTRADLDDYPTAWAGLALGVIATLTALVVLACELWWLRQGRRALAGRLDGLAVATELAADETVPDWSLTPKGRRVALVVERAATGYRDARTRVVIAQVAPLRDLSWRMLALPIAIALIAWRWS